MGGNSQSGSAGRTSNGRSSTITIRQSADGDYSYNVSHPKYGEESGSTPLGKVDAEKQANRIAGMFETEDGRATLAVDRVLSANLRSSSGLSSIEFTTRSDGVRVRVESDRTISGLVDKSILTKYGFGVPSDLGSVLESAGAKNTKR